MHIPIKYHLLREQDDEQVVNLEYLATHDQVYDILTKQLPRTSLENLRKRM